MNAKKGLQKFTESKIKVNALLKRKKIAAIDIEALNLEEKRLLGKIITERLKKMTGEERDEAITQFESIATQDSKNQIWESNHSLINSAIANLMQEYGCMPGKNSIASKTGLSRQTINKHLKEFNTHPLYLIELEQFRFMASKVLAKIFKFAVNGDIKAAKLYFEIIGGIGGQPFNSTMIKQQNNYIQINSTVVSQENIKLLSHEQLIEIENIVKLALPALRT